MCRLYETRPDVLRSCSEGFILVLSGRNRCIIYIKDVVLYVNLRCCDHEPCQICMIVVFFFLSPNTSFSPGEATVV